MDVAASILVTTKPTDAMEPQGFGGHRVASRGIPYELRAVNTGSFETKGESGVDNDRGESTSDEDIRDLDEQRKHKV
jgi:hypothetical protein